MKKQPIYPDFFLDRKPAKCIFDPFINAEFCCSCKQKYYKKIKNIYTKEDWKKLSRLPFLSKYEKKKRFLSTTIAEGHRSERARGIEARVDKSRVGRGHRGNRQRSSEGLRHLDFAARTYRGYYSLGGTLLPFQTFENCHKNTHPRFDFS